MLSSLIPCEPKNHISSHDPTKRLGSVGEISPVDGLKALLPLSCLSAGAGFNYSAGHITAKCNTNVDSHLPPETLHASMQGQNCPHNILGTLILYGVPAMVETTAINFWAGVEHARPSPTVPQRPAAFCWSSKQGTTVSSKP